MEQPEKLQLVDVEVTDGLHLRQLGRHLEKTKEENLGKTSCCEYSSSVDMGLLASDPAGGTSKKLFNKMYKMFLYI